MKTKPSLILSLTLFSSILFIISIARADDFTATNNGDWSQTNIWTDNDNPTNLAVPGTNDDADIPSGIDVTINSTASVQFIYDDGTVTMGPGATLAVVGDPAGANGTYLLGNLDCSAPGNTVIYSGNVFWAKHQNYCNLIFSNTVTTNLIDFYNGVVNGLDPAAAMMVSNISVIGKIKVQMGADFTVNGNLTMGTNSQWDCSSYNLTVVSNTVMGGLFLDLDAASGNNVFEGNMLIMSNAVGWNVSNVTNWFVDGSLTNYALVAGSGYGQISFNGVGTITGKPFTLPTISINGSYEIGTTITLVTNGPALNGTVIFDIANTNKIILKAYPTNQLAITYGGNLDVINTGATPATGNIYKFFTATNYGTNSFASETFPALSAGLSWVDTLTNNGSISVTGSITTTPIVITSVKYNTTNNSFALIWNSSPSLTYSILMSTNLSAGAGSFTNVLATGITSGGSSTTDTVTTPGGNAEFIRISQP